MGPVNGSLYDDDAVGGVETDSFDMYLEPPVKGSEYADVEDTVEAEGRCRDAPIKQSINDRTKRLEFKRELTCIGIHEVVISTQVYPARIFFDKLNNLVNIGERHVILFEKLLGSSERIF